MGRFDLFIFYLIFNIRSGYVSEHRNPVPLRYRSEHLMRIRHLFLVSYYFRSNMATEHVVVTFGLKVEDAFDSFEGVQTKIKEIEDKTPAALQIIGVPTCCRKPGKNKFIFQVLEMFLNFTKSPGKNTAFEKNPLATKNVTK